MVPASVHRKKKVVLWSLVLSLWCYCVSITALLHNQRLLTPTRDFSGIPSALFGPRILSHVVLNVSSSKGKKNSRNVDTGGSEQSSFSEPLIRKLQSPLPPPPRQRSKRRHQPQKHQQELKKRNGESSIESESSASSNEKRSTHVPLELLFSTKTSKRRTSRRLEKKRSSTAARGSLSLNEELTKLRSRRPGGIVLAEERLQQAIDEWSARMSVDDILPPRTPDDNAPRSNGLQLPPPDRNCFHTVMIGLAKDSARKGPTSAKRCEAWLRSLEAVSVQSNEKDGTTQPTIFTYNSVLEAYCAASNSKKSNSKQHRTQENCQLSVLRLYREICDKTKDRNDENSTSPIILPNSYTYNLVLKSNSLSSSEWKVLEDWAWEFLQPDFDSSSEFPASRIPELPKPDRQTYNSLLRIYASSGDEEKARRLLDLLHKKSLTHGSIKTPSPVSFRLSPVWLNHVLKAMSQNLRPGVQNRAIQLVEEYRNDCDYDISTYNHLLHIHAQLGDTEAAEHIVSEIQNPLVPDVVTFTTLLKAYAIRMKKSQDKNLSMRESLILAQNATSILERMREVQAAQSTGTGKQNLRPNERTYNALFTIWAMVGNPNALLEMSELLQDMINKEGLSPTSVTYTTLIHGWTKNLKRGTVSSSASSMQRHHAGRQAEDWLGSLESLHPPYEPGSISWVSVYNSVISAYAKSGNHEVAPDKAEQLLQQLIQKCRTISQHYASQGQRLDSSVSTQLKTLRPDCTTFLCVLDAYAKAEIDDAPTRCEALLHHMNEMNSEWPDHSLTPDRRIYNAVLNALAKSRNESSGTMAEDIVSMMESSSSRALQPDIITYSCLLNCLTKSKGISSVDAAKRADELLRFVEGNYRYSQAGGLKSADADPEMMLKPNAVFYSSVLQAWAKDGLYRKAENLVRRNWDMYHQATSNDYAKPHVMLYNAVMDAIVEAAPKDAGNRAHMWLQELEEIYEASSEVSESTEEDLKPNRRSYNAVLLAYRNERTPGNSEKTEQLLMKMLDLTATGRQGVHPNVISFNAVIGSVVEDGNTEGAADRAQGWLDRMEAEGIRPDGRTYSYILEGWLKRNDEKGYRLAEVMLQRFLRQVEEYKTSLAGKKGVSTERELYEKEVWDVVNAYPKSRGIS